MSMLEPEDIAIWEEKQKANNEFEVKLLKIPEFDQETGKEISDDEHYAVCNKSKGSMNFVCYDKRNADDLCEFLNNECIIDDSLAIEAFVMDNCIEWDNLIGELSKKEIQLHKLKEKYKLKSDKILEDARKIKEETNEDIIKNVYGGNNDKTRAKFVKDSLVKESKEIKNLEFSISYINKRIPFLKALVYVKTALIEVKKE